MNEAIAGSRALRAVGHDLALRRGRLGAEIEAATGDLPWGDDEYGAAFDRRYRPVERQVLAAWEQLAAYVAGLGDAAEHTYGKKP